MSQFLDEMRDATQKRILELGSVPSGAPIRCVRASFADAVRGKDRLSIIAEFKRRSPSRGAIAEGMPVEAQVRDYVDHGAAAVSVLTEPTRFGGSYKDLDRAAHTVQAPLLMKDFIADAVQLHMGVTAGASAALLIVRFLPPKRLRELAAVCFELGLTPLIECGEEDELEIALSVEGAVIGINNRNLGTLDVDRSRALRLLPLIPSDRIAIAESGYSSGKELRELVGLADAVLIGTALMQGTNPKDLLQGVVK